MKVMTNTPLLVQVTIDTIEAAAKVLILSLARTQLPAMRAKPAPSRSLGPPPATQWWWVARGVPH